jgi:HlyD family secretion protein
MVLQLNQQSQPPSTPAKSSTKNRAAQAKALEQPNSPEQLDLPLQIITPKRWLSLLGLGAIVLTATVWSIRGSIPVTVSGNGILLYPSQIKTVQSPSVGKIDKVYFKVGDFVKRGQSLANIDQSELKQQLELGRSKRSQLQLQDEAAQAAQLTRSRLEQTTIGQQRQSIQQEIYTLQSQVPILHQAELTSIQQQKQALQSRLATLRKQAEDYTRMWERLQTAQAAIARNELIQKKYELVAKPEADILEVETQLKQLDTKEAAAQQQQTQNINRVAALQSELSKLNSQQAGQDEEGLAKTTARQKEIQETTRTIAQLELQLKQNAEIRSDHDGYIRELNLTPGQRIEAGKEIGVIASSQQNAKLQGIIFLPVSEGKKIGKNMKVLTTPTTVKREELGGIEGKVTDVSQAPITVSGAAHLVGNPSVLASIMDKDGAYIAIFTDLDTTSANQYRWSSSKGPRQPITEGTTTTVKITIEEVVPISYVMPFIKSLLGQS